jgi:hypothetical protein
MDVGEWIFRIDRSNDFIRIRYRLAEADLTLRLRCSTAPGATIAADAWDAFPSDSVLILKAGAPRSDADKHGDRTRLWVTAETAVKCADHNPLLIDQATKTLETAQRREGMLD